MSRVGGWSVVVLFVVGMIVYGSTKSPTNDPPQGNLPMPSQPMHMPPMMAGGMVGDGLDTNDFFRISDFKVSTENQQVVFEIEWSEGLFEALGSRYVDLFMSTNLIGHNWVKLNSYWIDAETNQCVLSISPYYVKYSVRQNFIDSFGKCAFFVFGLDIDSDGDNLTDAYEKYVTGSSPKLADTDFDGLTDDDEEEYYGSDVNNPDTDGDGILDGEEISYYHSDLLNADSDGDGLADVDEASGYYEYSGALWQDGIIVSNLFDAAFGDIDSGVCNLALPAPVMLSGAAYSNIVVDVNGLVYLSQTNVVLSSLDSNLYLEDSQWNKADVALAPLWTDIVLRHDLFSEINFKTNELNDCVIEFLNVGFNDIEYATNSISFQVILSSMATNRIIFSYLDFQTDYRYGLSEGTRCGLRFERHGDENGVCTYAYPCDGDSTCVFRFGYGTRCDDPDTDNDGLTDYDEIITYGTDPTNEDPDGDGLSDYDEIMLYFTDPFNSDSDGDGLSDAWEIKYGLDPLSSLGDDGFDGDPDGDGLNNMLEYKFKTNPMSADTDEDGLSDASETGYYSCVTNSVHLDTSNAESVLPSSLYAQYDDNVFIATLPFPVTCGGITATNVAVSVNGCVALLNTNSTDEVWFGIDNYAMDRYTFYDSHLCVAAYWDDLCMYSELNSDIVFADAEAMVANHSITNTPVFSINGTQMFSRNATQIDVWNALAKYVPAVSSPMGKTRLTHGNITSYELNGTAFRNGWGRSHFAYGENWLHSDMKDMAYYYVYSLYNEIITKGHLK